MKSQLRPDPPKWVSRILEWYCNEDILEDLQGDINEFYYRNVEKKGSGKAKFIYFLDVIKFFRPYAIQKPKIKESMDQFTMFNNYFKTSFRNIIHNKLFSSINIVGLAISMSVGLLLIAFITELFSFDTFHEKADRIYRVTNTYHELNRDPDLYASTSVKAGKRLQESVTGIEKVVLIRRNFSGDVTNGDDVVPIRGLWASEEFFNVFSFKLIKGNPESALRELNSLVLTEASAIKLFGKEEAFGKTVSINEEEYTITGIVEDVPKNSHMRFEVLCSFVTKDNREAGNDYWLKWENMWSNYVYILLPEDHNVNEVQENLDRISQEENANLEHNKITMGLLPLLDILPGENMNNKMGVSMDLNIVWVLTILSFVVIISACFNYTNLSISRSLRRSLEVGIRKVIGASRLHILFQFITEAVIISLISLVFSFLFFIILRTQFIGIDPKISRIVTLDLTPQLLLYFLAMAIMVGIIAGFFPAVFFSKVNAIKVLKDASNFKLFGHVSIRKSLMVLQYTLSLAFIVAASITYKQYKFALSFDLGYKTENILNIPLEGNKPDILVNELARLPEVENISRSIMITSIGDYWAARGKYNNPLDSALVYFNIVDENYLPIHQHQFLAGSNFVRGSENEEADNNQIIVNEALLKRFEIESPSKAIGEILKLDGKENVIVGVLIDFHYGRIDNKIKSFAYRFDPKEPDYLNLKINTTDFLVTITKIEKIWKKIDKVHPLRAKFYDESIKKAYDEYSSMVKITGFLAFLAISIASMGLLGMVIFATESRLKEISIRKVMGAGEINLVYLLGRGFIILLFISAVIAIPITYYFFENVMFKDLAYKADIGAVELFSGAMAVMIIALFTVGVETVKASRANPAKTLRNE